jgi:hypothetical protein
MPQITTKLILNFRSPETDFYSLPSTKKMPESINVAPTFKEDSSTLRPFWVLSQQNVNENIQIWPGKQACCEHKDVDCVAGTVGDIRSWVASCAQLTQRMDNSTSILALGLPLKNKELTFYVNKLQNIIWIFCKFSLYTFSVPVTKRSVSSSTFSSIPSLNLNV